MYALMFDKELLEDVFGDGKKRAEYQLSMLCAKEVEAVYSPLIASLYARDRLTSLGRAQASSILQTLKQEVVDSVSGVAWLDSDAKQLLVHQLESVTVRLWPPSMFDKANAVEELYGLCPENDDSFVVFWIKARHCLRAIFMKRHRYYAENLLPSWTPLLTDYVSSLNTLDIAMAALTAPLYYNRGTLGMIYGGLGFLLAVALMGVLREPPQYMHPNGSLSKSGSWISEQSMEALKQKQRCSDQAQSAKSFRGIEIGAMEVAYYAFHDRVIKSFQSNLTSELTDEKVFFMTFCRNVCAKKQVGRILWRVAGCNELVANSRGFSDAFGCSEQSPMKAIDKCTFFENDHRRIWT
ncbi:hypothetical protein V5799_003404 [Amblyomma americanum]|uniref:Uncharacterized protein n=1 Tax=Amblyomma americanum TaxID=6943 RepID=A0AAQ4D925_AMBAM